MSVMEMSHRGKAYVGIAAAGRGRPARTAGDSGQLQGAVPAGRRHGAVRGDSAEPQRARRGRRLRQHRHLVEEGDRRSQAVLQGQCRRRRGRGQVHHGAGAGRLAALDRCGLPALHAQRDHRRRRVPVRARHRRRAAGRRLVLDDPVAADRCQPIRRDLRRARRKTSARPACGRDRARGPARPARAPSTPTVFDWKAMAADGSMFNTPADLSWYVAGLVFQWIKRQGGLEAMAGSTRPRRACSTTRSMRSGFYRNPVAVDAARG